MTAIKQTSVTSRNHLASLKAYLDWNREKALAHDTLNIIDENRWFEEMDETRETAGHNKPGKSGARCTFMQHQIIGFNPDECSCNGGKMTPALCMKYARQYVLTRYPNQEAVIVLHEEHCKGDGTTRYAAHLGINRTNIETGHRLDEGPARQAAKARVATIRELDARYGLKQMERGKSNSLLHGRQPGRAERDMARKGQASRSENARIRATVARRIDEVGRIPGCHDRMKELARRLAKDGITLSRSKNGSLQYCFYSKSLGGTRKVNGARLGFARNARTGAITRFTVRGIKVALNSLAREMVNEMGREDDRR